MNSDKQNILVLNGFSEEELNKYPDNSFDSVVTDPPYGLGDEPDPVLLMKSWIEKGYYEVKGSGFMGKEWDAFVPQPVLWKEVFRVLKPGGHLIAFFGTRTYDWGVMALRFAGFEVRDSLLWMFFSGFPKSFNISKAIGKMSKASDRLVEFSKLLREKRELLNLTLSEADKRITNGSTMYSFLEGRNLEGAFKIYAPNKENYEKIKQVYGIEGWDDIVENNLETIGEEEGSYGYQKDGKRWNEKHEIKQATTDEAKKWEGWGTALKPSFEPIVLCRKPLEKGLTISENILKWGTGGIYIDGCRIATDDDLAKNYKSARQGDKKVGGRGVAFGFNRKKDSFSAPSENMLRLGRWPSNVIFSHSDECVRVGFKQVNVQAENEEGEIVDTDGFEIVEEWECADGCPIKELDKQSGIRKSGAMKKSYQYKSDGFSMSKAAGATQQIHEATSGYASRFFYVAKASRAEKEKGLESFETKPYGQSDGAQNSIKNEDGAYADQHMGYNRVKPRKNTHPTVKPVNLMRYLVKLVTPPGGILLDPFGGSGTTGIAAKLEGFCAVLIDREQESCDIAEARIAGWDENDYSEPIFIKDRPIKPQEPDLFS